MFYHTINPVLIKLGSIEIRYYGLLYVLGFIITYFMFYHLSKERKLKLSKDDVSDLILYLLAGIVLFARIFYVLFYNLKFYISNPLEIFAIWHGGLSFHGGLIGAVFAVWIFSKKHKIHIYEILDILAIPTALSLALGRIGNFLNGELWGRITDVPWAVKFQGAEGFRHPSQIYESIKNLIIFSSLWFLKNKKLKRGFLFWTFVSMYGFLRFLIEFFREPDSQLGFVFFNLSMGQILSAIMALVGILFLIRINKRK